MSPLVVLTEEQVRKIVRGALHEALSILLGNEPGEEDDPYSEEETAALRRKLARKVAGVRR